MKIQPFPETISCIQFSSFMSFRCQMTLIIWLIWLNVTFKRGGLCKVLFKQWSCLFQGSNCKPVTSVTIILNIICACLHSWDQLVVRKFCFTSLKVFITQKNLHHIISHPYGGSRRGCKCLMPEPKFCENVLLYVRVHRVIILLLLEMLKSTLRCISKQSFSFGFVYRRFWVVFMFTFSFTKFRSAIASTIHIPYAHDKH